MTNKVLILKDRYALQPNPIKGGMSEVYAATDLVQGHRKVAVKVLKTGVIESSLLRESYDRETKALRALRHPSVVELIDDGFDDQLGAHFMVLEWMDSSLAELLKVRRPENWDHFYQTVGRPVLEALKFAHERRVSHRDLKPSNILMDANATIKLADFGISKLKSLVTPGFTLNEFVTRPFAPKEFDDGSYTQTRDLHAFAVVALCCLHKGDITTYPEVEGALQQVELPTEIRDLLTLSLSDLPEVRPANAGVLLAKIEAVQEGRLDVWAAPETVVLSLTKKAESSLRTYFPHQSQSSMELAVREDLDRSSIEKYLPGGQGIPSDGHYLLFGSRFSCHAAISTDESHLLLINVQEPPQAHLEKRRNSAWQSNFRFAFGKQTNTIAAQKAVWNLRQNVDAHERDREERAREAEEQQLFLTLDATLRAKEFIEREREKPLKYTSVSIVGNRATLLMAEPVTDVIVGQARKISNGERILLFGDVEDVLGNKVVLYVTSLLTDPDSVPERGILSVDISAAKAALDRQKNALDAVRYGRAVRADVRTLLASPAKSRPPVDVPPLEFFQDLDSAKKDAVRAACGTEDFLIVEGPPGTGKTTFISELLLQLLKRNPRSRILLSSQTHVALDNAIERLWKVNKDATIVRVGRPNDPRISAAVEPVLISNRISQWKKDALDKGRCFLSHWAKTNGIQERHYEINVLLRKLGINKESSDDRELRIMELEQQKQEVLSENPGLQGGFSSQSDRHSGDLAEIEEELARIRTDLKELRADQLLLRKQALAVEPELAEILESSSAALRSWADDYFPHNPQNSQFRKFTEIWAEWETRFGSGESFEGALLASSQIVAGTCIGVAGIKGLQDVDFDLCIIDEASKATATETLVPISRSHRWILVGDKRQLPPYLEDELATPDILGRFNLAEEDFRNTILDRLEGHLPEGCHKPLSMQHRMVPAIGGLISHCFYNDELQSANSTFNSPFQRLLKRPVTWLSTVKLMNRWESKVDASYINNVEVKQVVQLLEDIQQEAAKVGAHFKIAVLTAYSGQKHMVEREIDRRRNRWSSIIVECNTVDAFQGREADIAIYSVTRCNSSGLIGFLKEKRRLNVALSRGRYHLILVGDHVFCRSAKGENPFYEVVKYIEQHPEHCAIEAKFR
jgi:hypothetical protein